MRFFLLLISSTLFAESLDYSKLKSIIQWNNLKSIDEVLEHLNPQDFERAIPFEVSRSLQSASAENPRVVVPNADGSFVFSFTADQAALSPHLSESNNALEIMQFDSTTNRFFFREISFPNGKATFAGEGKCVGCHKGSPNWQPYGLWPGAFGAYTKLTPREEALLKNFILKRNTHSRYRHIIPAVKKILDYGFNPNTQSLTKNFAALNARRIFGEIQNYPKYRATRVALIAAILDCPNIESFVPKATSNLEETKVDTLVKNAKFLGYAADRAVEGDDPLKLGKSALDVVKWNSMISKTRWIAREAMGIDIKHWSMAYPKGGFLFAEDSANGLQRLLPLLNQEKIAVTCGELPSIHPKNTPNF